MLPGATDISALSEEGWTVGTANEYTMLRDHYSIALLPDLSRRPRSARTEMFSAAGLYSPVSHSARRGPY